MTYEHKKNKCLKETKEILEEVLLASDEIYNCLDCAESILVENPMEHILAHEAPSASIELPTMTLENEPSEVEAEMESEMSASAYRTPDELEAAKSSEIREIAAKGKKKGAYVQSKEELQA